MPRFFERRAAQTSAVAFCLGIACGIMNQSKNLSYIATILILEATRFTANLIDKESAAGAAFLLGYSFGYFGNLAVNNIYDYSQPRFSR